MGRAPVKPNVLPSFSMRELTRKFWKDQIEKTLDDVNSFIQRSANEGVAAIAVTLSPDTDMCTVDAVLEWLSESGYNTELQCKVEKDGRRTITILISWVTCIGFGDMAFAPTE